MQALKGVLLGYLSVLTQSLCFQDAWLLLSECLKTPAQASLWFLPIRSSPNHKKPMSRRWEQWQTCSCVAINHIPTGDNRLKQDQDPKKPQSITKYY